MKVACTEKSQVLASKLAKALEIPLIHTQFKSFPDGEIYLRNGDPDEETVIVAGFAGSDSLVQTLLLIDACEGSKVTLVLPYMGYARQDKKFNPGEPVSARAMAAALSRGVSRVVTVNIHESTVLGHFTVPATDVTLAPEIGAHIATLGLENPLILGPDGGAAVFARDVAAAGGWEADHLTKTRLSGEEVRIAPKEVAVQDRDVVIVDDIISTGGTLATAAGMLREQGAASVRAACVHGVFASAGYARLAAAGLEAVMSSDTIESAASAYTAADAIARALR